MEDEKKAIDELLFIKKVIQDSRNIVIDNGMGYVVWGILVAIGMFFGYVKFSFNLQFDYIWAWVVLIGAGWIFSFFAYYRKRSVKVETFAGRILGRLWFATGMSMTIVGFGGYFSGAIRGDFISAVIAIILGSAYYLTSLLYEWKWWRIIGVMWWVGGIVLFYVHDVAQFLIMGTLIIVGQVIPGLVLYKKYKSQAAE